MKPIKLKIKGFNSFIEEQVIDFKKLTDTGVFGIFGSTGSGKSSVIDAMTFALYGSVSRYESDERRGFINVNTNSAVVVFEFSITLNKTIFYEVSREIKKNKNGNITHNARLIKKDEKNTEVVSEKAKKVTEEIVKIIGLDYKDFIRSVVLPQGKFSEFLMLKNIERRNMLERIFGLEEYGTILNAAVNEKKKEQTKIVGEIKSKLKVFGGISESAIKDCENIFEGKGVLLEECKKKWEEKNKIFEKYKNYIDLKKEFDILKNKETALKEKKEDIERKKDKVGKGKRAEKAYNYIIDYKKSLREYTNVFSEYEKCRNDYEETEKNFSLAKEEYDLFTDEKKEKYPLIIKKETELKRGEELNKYINDIKEEREKLLKDYKRTENIILKKRTYYNAEKNLKEEIELKIQYEEGEIEKYYISPEYRKDIEESANTEKTFYELNDKYILEVKNGDNIFKNIKKQENEISDTEKKIAEVSEEIESLNRKRNLCEKNNNLSFFDIVNMQKKIEEEKAEFINKKGRREKYDSQKKEYDFIISDSEKLSKELNEILKKETKMEKDLLELEEKIKLLENKEFILELALNLREDSPCPVCGSFHHPAPARNIADGVLEKFIEDKKTLKKEINKLSLLKNDINAKKAVCDSKISKLNEEFDKADGDIKTFDIENSEKIIKTKIKDFEKSKKNFEKYQSDIKEFENTEKKMTSELNSLKVMLAEMKRGKEKDNENFENSKKIAQEIFKKKCDAEEIFNEVKKRFGIDDFKKEYTKITDYEKIKNKLEKEKKINDIALQKKRLEIEKLTTEIGDYEKRLESIKIIGKEKKTVIERNMSELEKICGGRNISEYIKEISQKKNFYDEKEILLNKKIKDMETKKNTIYENSIKFEKEKDALNKVKESAFENLKNALAENGFSDAEEAEKAYLSSEEIEFIEEEINNYNRDAHVVSSNLKDISEKINKCDITCSEEDIDILAKDIAELNENTEKIAEERGQLKNKISDMKNNLLKVCELNKEAEIQTHRLDLITDLANTIKGNKFVEFISRRQLYYITRDASERLKKMTGGRYAIELDGGDVKNSETANFVIRDDSNGGVRRPSQSLSGGEVFLTSLNLALALFGKIQLKNNTSIETFFLDEGFGTLDLDVLDTVMDGLEKLTLENMNVGIITHIEEVKNRVQSKIIIEPSDGTKGARIREE